MVSANLHDNMHVHIVLMTALTVQTNINCQLVTTGPFSNDDLLELFSFYVARLREPMKLMEQIKLIKVKQLEV